MVAAPADAKKVLSATVRGANGYESSATGA